MAQFAQAAWPWITMGVLIAVAVVKMNGGKGDK